MSDPFHDHTYVRCNRDLSGSCRDCLTLSVYNGRLTSLVRELDSEKTAHLKKIVDLELKVCELTKQSMEKDKILNDTAALTNRVNNLQTLYALRRYKFRK